MQIIPVIDLMGGQVVRGVAGRRDEYRPIQSRLSADASPASIARAFLDLGYRRIYLADLDAIASCASDDGRGGPAWETYRQLLALGVELVVDAGLCTAAQARAMADFRADGRSLAGVVAGLESLAGPRALTEICAVSGRERLIFSLDLKHGVPLAGSDAWAGLSSIEIATIALRAGVRRMIVLDLAQVGVGQGVGTLALCRSLRRLAPELEIIAGGGVRGTDDLGALMRAGCDAALVASALHDGRIGAGGIPVL